eukprot:6183290-Pleurochrysis_carterae.AAC.1
MTGRSARSHSTRVEFNHEEQLENDRKGRKKSQERKEERTGRGALRREPKRPLTYLLACFEIPRKAIAPPSWHNRTIALNWKAWRIFRSGDSRDVGACMHAHLSSVGALRHVDARDESARGVTDESDAPLRFTCEAQLPMKG